jgi:ubiquinone/menaquinone biosynthesis C-methylase UbiE
MNFSVQSALHHPLADGLTQAAYEGLQWGKSIFSVAHRTVINRFTKTFLPPAPGQLKSLTPKAVEQLQQRRQDLLKVDWLDAQAGLYPVELLFDTPWDEIVRYYPLLVLDWPQSWARLVQKKYHEFPEGVDRQAYPKYYLQNFHYQTDGYLSDFSANLYDLQVELLFGGMADPMRRRIIKLLKGAIAQGSNNFSQPGKLLDVACGTGRTLRLLQGAFPEFSLFGLDLSAAYLRKANQLLTQLPGALPQLVESNAEAMPYQNEVFQLISSVFLFHELPSQARQNVIQECFRVLKPGGAIVICDSIQLADSADLTAMMENFTIQYHEPYYSHYVRDDLAARLTEAGFVDIATEIHFLSKYLVVHKPA